MRQQPAALTVQQAKMGDLELEVVDLAGELWFYAPALARALGMRDGSQLTRSLKADEHCARLVTTSAGARVSTLVHESGFYRLIFASRSPVAERLREWVLYDLLPLHRKTGQWRLIDQARRYGLKLEYTEAQWEWLSYHAEYRELLPLALAGYSATQISLMLGYKTKRVTAAARIAKMRKLGLLPAKIPPRTAQLEGLIKAQLADGSPRRQVA